MENKHWKILFVLNFLFLLMPLFPFLPGPSKFSSGANAILNLFQLISMFSLILFPLGLISHIRQRLRKKKNVEYFPFGALLVWTISLTIFISTNFLTQLLRGYARNMAIKNSSSLISSIESFKAKEKRYPSSFEELIPDYLKTIPEPNVMGINKYKYQNKDSSFNISFEQNVFFLFNYEVCIYDPKENHKAEGELKKLYDTGIKHWKFYIFD
jgi:hypothetical protein